MTLKKRLALIILVFAVQSLYIPINRTLQSGFIFSTHLDPFVPLWPIWVVPYMLVMGWWIVGGVWMAVKMEETLYRAFIIAALSVTLTALGFFVFFPTCIERPALVGTDWATELLRYLYTHDRIYNAFPSGHVYLTTLFGLFWARWFPRQQWLWVSIVVVVTLSTLFTRQHYLPDAIGGLVLAWLGYCLGFWWVSRRNAQPWAAKAQSSF